MMAADPIPAVIIIARRQVIRALLACMSLLILAGLAAQVSTWFWGHDYLFGLVPKFNLDAENNLPTWFSTICLFLCALALAVIGLAEWRRQGPLFAYWFGLAGTFVLLSVDEAASFHEMLARPLESAWHTGGFFRFAWVIPGGLFVIVFVLVFSSFLRRIPAETRRHFVVAGLVYCSGCLGMEMIAGKYLSISGPPDFNYSLMAILEESLEMIGEILFLRALLAYLANHVGSLTVRLEQD
jgi:asparagine N-glycosylation enzyme membrane subunit Stt3